MDDAQERASEERSPILQKPLDLDLGRTDR
jgi:hypothetical protein